MDSPTYNSVSNNARSNLDILVTNTPLVVDRLYAVHELTSDHTCVSSVIFTSIVPTEIDDMVNKIKAAVSRAREVSVPKQLVTHRPFGVKLLSIKLLRLRRVALRRLYRCYNPAEKAKMRETVQQLTALAVYHLVQDRNANFRQLFTKLNSREFDPSRHKIWKLAKYFRSGNWHSDFLLVGDRNLYIDMECAEALVDQFANVNNDSIPNPPCRDLFDQLVFDFFEEMMNLEIDAETVSPATVAEISGHIRRFRPFKVAGRDGLPNVLLKQMPRNGLIHVTTLANSVLTSGYWPQQFKLAKIIPIPKTSVILDPKDLRLISLTSSLSKIILKVVNTRFGNHLTENNLLPEHQFGFRVHRSATQQLVRVDNFIQRSKAHGLNVGIISLNIKKAFDTMWLKGLLHKMRVAKFPDYLTKLIAGYCRDRTICVSYRSALSGCRVLRADGPQGSVLMPSMYAFFTADIPTSNETMLATFADDTAIMATSSQATGVTTKLQKEVDQIQKFFVRWRLTINPMKTTGLYVPKDGKARRLPRIEVTVTGTAIPWAPAIKYLGVWFDSKRAWSIHLSKAHARVL